jgi:hypothetical protein
LHSGHCAVAKREKVRKGAKRENNCNMHSMLYKTKKEKKGTPPIKETKVLPTEK